MRLKRFLSVLITAALIFSVIPMNVSANYEEDFYYDRRTFNQAYPMFTGEVAKEPVDFSAVTVSEMLQTIQDADKATGENKYWLDKLLVNEGPIPDFSTGEDILFSRGRGLYMRSHTASALGFVGDISYGDSLYVGEGYRISLEGKRVSEVPAERKNYPSHSHNIFRGDNLEVDSKKYITYNNSAVTQLEIKNTGSQALSFNIITTSALTQSMEGNELVGQVQGPKMAQLAGKEYVEGTTTLNIRVSATDATASNQKLITPVTIQPGETYKYKVVMGVMTEEIPESFKEYEAYKNYDFDTAFATHVEVYNQWWADNIPYIDVPNEYVKKVIYYRWWATRFNMFDGNIPGNDWQFPAQFEGVTGYNNVITVSVPWLLQDLKYLRTPLYAYGTWAAQGEVSGEMNYQNNPGRPGIWTWDMMQYTTDSGWDAFRVHGGNAEMLAKFAKYGYDDVKGQYNEFPAPQRALQYDELAKYLVYYSHPPITGNDNDNVSAFYKRNYGSNYAGNVSLGRVDGTSTVYGNATATSEMYDLLYKVTGNADYQAKSKDMSTLANNIRNAVLKLLWTDDFVHMDVDKELDTEVDRIPGSGVKEYVSTGHGSFLHLHTGSTENGYKVELNPWRDNNFFPFNFKLVPTEGEEGYDPKYKEMLKDYDTNMYPVFPFFTADQVSTEEKRIGLYEEFEKYDFHGNTGQPHGRDYGSNNFAFCNGGNYLNTLANALRYYPTENITSETMDRLIQWMAFTHYVKASGSGTKDDPVIADASYLDSNEFFWFNGYFNAYIQFPSDGLGPEIKGNMTRAWIHHNVLGMMNFTFIEDIAGLQPRTDNLIELYPIGVDYDYYVVDNVRYHDSDLTIVWQDPSVYTDENPKYKGIPVGYTLYVDGKYAFTVNEQVHLIYDPNNGTLTYPENAKGAVGNRSENFKEIYVAKTGLLSALDVDFTNNVLDPNTEEGIKAEKEAQNKPYDPYDYLGEVYNNKRTIDLMQKLGIDLFHPGTENLALDAEVSFSCKVTDPQYINDGSTVSGSPGTSGNGSSFPRRSTLFDVENNATDWVQFDFKEPKTVDSVKLYFYNDRKLTGYSEPAMYTVKYLDENGEYVPVDKPYKSPSLPKANYNLIEFPEIETTSLRIEFVHKGTSKTAVKEIQIFDNDLVVRQSVNAAPAAIPGEYSPIRLGTSFKLTGAAYDDGLPNGTITALWEVVGVPEGMDLDSVELATPDQLTTEVNFPATGNYTFKLTVSDGELSSSALVTVTVLEPYDPFNAALLAVASTNKVTGWNRVAAVNDGETPYGSNVGDQTEAYGNWGVSAEGEDGVWVQLTWDEEMTLVASSVYFFDDRPTPSTIDSSTWEGVAVPDSYEFKYLDSNGEWQLIECKNGGFGTELDKFNETEFAQPVTTKAIRIYLHRNNLATGIVEWEVRSDTKLVSDWVDTVIVKDSIGNTVERLTDNSGLVGKDDAAIHSTDTADMWSEASGTSEVVYLDFDIRRVMDIGKIAIWNYNEDGATNKGLKDITISYSTDGENFTKLLDCELAEGGSQAQVISFDKVNARYFRISWASNHGGEGVGLSEVKFMKAYTIKSINPATVITYVNEWPDLPAKVKVIYTDNSPDYLKVEWDTSEIKDKITVAQTFTINGTIEGTDQKAVCTIIVKYNKGELANAINAAKPYLGYEPYYTPESWQAFIAAYNKAVEIYNNENATAGDIGDATSELLTAIKNLKESGYTVDKSALQAAVDKALSLNESNYTAGSWSALMSAVAYAKTILEDTESRFLQSEIDEVTAMVEEAIANLVLVGGNIALTAKPSTSYVSSWETLEAVNDGSISNGKKYGNWGSSNDVNWVQYDWTSPVLIEECSIYFFDDRPSLEEDSATWTGVAIPNSYKYEYLNENGEWVEMTSAGGYGREYNKFNLTVFDTPVITKAIRVTMDRGGLATGIVEWIVNGKYASNIATKAKPSASYTAPWNSLAALNDELVSDTSNPSDSEWGQSKIYGNWGDFDTSSSGYDYGQWIQYDWDSEVLLSGASIYFYDNRPEDEDPETWSGVGLPDEYYYQYPDEEGKWITIETTEQLIPTLDQFNTATFVEPIKTTSLRVVLIRKFTDPESSELVKGATGIIEWEAIGHILSEQETGLDYTALDAAIAAAEEIMGDESKYTAESWAVFIAAYEAAKAVRADAEATQEDVDAAAAALIDAQASLELSTGLDYTALDAAIAAAEGIINRESRYTSTSWAAFKAAYEAAKAVRADAEATQEDVDAATTALVDAQNALKKKPSSDSIPAPVVIYYTITSTAGEGGSITESARVQSGSDKTFYIVPDEGYVIKDVLVNGISVGAVESYTFNNVMSDATIEAIFEKVEKDKEIEPDDDMDDDMDYIKKFIDVSEDDWFSDAVNTVVKAGLFNGVSENQFAPQIEMTREMFVTILGRLHGINPDEYSECKFEDVDMNMWYGPYVAWSVSAGIATGYNDVTFGTGDLVTREEMAVFIARYLKYANIELSGAADDKVFADDNEISSWARDAVYTVKRVGLISGKTGNVFDPKGNATRAEVATVFSRLLKLLEK